MAVPASGCAGRSCWRRFWWYWDSSSSSSPSNGPSSECSGSVGKGSFLTQMADTMRQFLQSCLHLPTVKAIPLLQMHISQPLCGTTYLYSKLSITATCWSRRRCGSSTLWRRHSTKSPRSSHSPAQVRATKSFPSHTITAAIGECVRWRRHSTQTRSSMHVSTGTVRSHNHLMSALSGRCLGARSACPSTAARLTHGLMPAPTYRRLAAVIRAVLPQG